MKDKDQYYFWGRGLINDNVVRSGQALDNIVLVITTGGLVLTITAYQILGVLSVIWLYILLFSDVVLLVALFMHCLSYWRSINSNRERLGQFDNWMVKGFVGPLDNKDNVATKLYWGRSGIDTLSFVLMWFGILGMVAFIFNGVIVKNMNNNNIDSKKTAENIIPPAPNFSEDANISVSEEPNNSVEVVSPEEGNREDNSGSPDF